MISKNFNKRGSSCNHAHSFGCDLVATTPIFSKTQIECFGLVLIKYNKQLEKSQLPYGSE